MNEDFIKQVLSEFERKRQPFNDKMIDQEAIRFNIEWALGESCSIPPDDSLSITAQYDMEQGRTQFWLEEYVLVRYHDGESTAAQDLIDLLEWPASKPYSNLGTLLCNSNHNRTLLERARARISVRRMKSLAQCLVRRSILAIWYDGISDPLRLTSMEAMQEVLRENIDSHLKEYGRPAG